MVTLYHWDLPQVGAPPRACPGGRALRPPVTARLNSADAAGEIRRLAERQHGGLLPRLCQPVLRALRKQGQVLDHLQQPLGRLAPGGLLLLTAEWDLIFETVVVPVGRCGGL